MYSLKVNSISNLHSGDTGLPTSNLFFIESRLHIVSFFCYPISHVDNGGKGDDKRMAIGMNGAWDNEDKKVFPAIGLSLLSLPESVRHVSVRFRKTVLYALYNGLKGTLAKYWAYATWELKCSVSFDIALVRAELGPAIHTTSCSLRHNFQLLWEITNPIFSKGLSYSLFLWHCWFFCATKNSTMYSVSVDWFFLLILCWCSLLDKGNDFQLTRHCAI